MFFKKTGLIQFKNFLERSIKNQPISRTGYQFQGEFQNRVGKIGPFLERGINFRGIFLRKGCQFGVPGGTYPPRKYPRAPPRGRVLVMQTVVQDQQNQLQLGLINQSINQSINLLFHSTNCVSYKCTFSQQIRKTRVGTLDKPFWA